MASDYSTLVRAAAVLTTDYVASDDAQVGNTPRVSLDLDFALGSLTSIDIVVEVTSGGVWRTSSVIKATAGAVAVYPATFTLLPADWGTASTGTSILLDVANAKLRVKVRGNGDVTGSSLAVTISEG